MLNNCCKLCQKLLSIPDNELSPQQRRILKKHLQESPDCALYNDKIKQALSLLKTIPAPDMEPGLPLQLEEFINKPESEPNDVNIISHLSLYIKQLISAIVAITGALHLLTPQTKYARLLKRLNSYLYSWLIRVIASGIVITAIFLFWFAHSNSLSSNSPSVNMPGVVDQGETVSIMGRNVAHNTGVFITFNWPDRPVVTNNQSQSPVSDDGTFNARVPIDTNWLPGSPHTLYVLGQDGKTLIISKPFHIRNHQTASTLALCGNGQTEGSVSLGPVVEGDSQTVKLNLCAQGPGDVDWSSDWDKQNNSWLHLDQSGHIQAAQSQQIQISASTASLKPGTYTAPVTFTTTHAKDKSATIKIDVTLLVQPKAGHSCISSDRQKLTYTSTTGQAPPEPQAITLHNCGDKGDWSASVTTTDGSNWLGIASTYGELNSDASQKLAVSVNPVNIAVGTYTGTVTVGMGSSTVQIQVTIVVNANVQSIASPCVSVTQTPLTFTAVQGGNDPTAQRVTISNGCGEYSWLGSVDQSWLSLSNTSGKLPVNSSVSLDVQASIANMAVGTYTGHVAFGSASNANIAHIDVTLTVTAPQAKPCIAVNPTALSFTAKQGSNPSPQSFTVNNCGDEGTVITSVSTKDSGSWLSAGKGGSLASPGRLVINVSLHIQGMAVGTYTGYVSVTFKDANGVTSTVQVKVNLTISPPVVPIPCISTNPTALSFTTKQGSSLSPQSFTVNNCGDEGTITTSVSTNNGRSWLSAGKGGSLASPGRLVINVSLNVQGMAVGTYTGYVSVTFKDANGVTSTVQVKVNLTISPPVVPIP